MIAYVKNYKGGVGKSTITRNLAHFTALCENKTLIVTFDSQNDSYRMLKPKRWEGTEGFHKFVSTGEDTRLKLRTNLHYFPLETDIFGSTLEPKLLKAFEDLKKEYDIIFIDGAPAQYTLLDKIGVKVADKIIVPMVMDEPSFNGFAKFMQTEDGKKVSMVIPNLYTGSKINKAYNGALKEYLADTGIFMSSPVKKVSMEEELVHLGKSIFDSKSKRLDDVKDVYAEILGAIANG